SIATDLILNASQPAECGPLYHALNSLIMYRDRARGPQTPADGSLELAEQTPPDPAQSASAGDPTAMPVVEPDAFAPPKESMTGVAVEPGGSPDANASGINADAVVDAQPEPTP